MNTRLTRLSILSTIAFAIIATAMVTVACGTSSGNGDDSADQSAIDYPFDVRQQDAVLSIDDLKAVQGVKANKEYDVTDLPAATAAWRVLFNQHDYEVRFYPDQATAIDQGAPYAQHVTGDNAVVVGDDVLWEEGAKDRRRCSRNEKTPHAGCSYSSRYWDFVILGNMIMMCEGLESDQAIRNCNQLIELIQ